MAFENNWVYNGYEKTIFQKKLLKIVQNCLQVTYNWPKKLPKIYFNGPKNNKNEPKLPIIEINWPWSAKIGKNWT